MCVDFDKYDLELRDNVLGSVNEIALYLALSPC